MTVDDAKKLKTRMKVYREDGTEGRISSADGNSVDIHWADGQFWSFPLHEMMAGMFARIERKAA